MFASVAHAMGTAGAGQAGGADALMQFVPLIAMLAIFYFLLIRPQQKRAKQHKAMLEALKKGDQVLTTGGLVGRVVDIDGDILSIDLGSTTVSLGRAYVVSVMDPRSKAVKEEDRNAILKQLQDLEQEKLYKVPLFTVGNYVFTNSNVKIPEGVTFCNPLYSCDLDFANWEMA